MIYNFSRLTALTFAIALSACSSSRQELPAITLSQAMAVIRKHEGKAPGTTVYTTKKGLHLQNGVLIPAATQLMLDEQMSEGFTRLMLYVNVPPALERTHFKKAVDTRHELKIPYWVTLKPAEPLAPANRRPLRARGS